MSSALQLRALARAAVAGNLKVMMPMVTVPDELDRCRALFESGRGAAREGRRRMPPLGMMVEVPAAALPSRTSTPISSRSAATISSSMWRPRAGTTQLADLRVLRAPVFGLMGMSWIMRTRSGREVSLCGDLGGDPAQVAALLDQGLRSFSVAPAALGPSRLRSPAIPALPHEHASDAGRFAGADRGLQGYPSRVLDRRPSGTRQRLADALGKNRSFVSQITNPAYQTPIPAQHFDPIFEICHFSAQESGPVPRRLSPRASAAAAAPQGARRGRASR